MLSGKIVRQMIAKRLINKPGKSGKGRIILIILFIFLAGVVIASFYLFRDLPSPKTLSTNQFPVSSKIYDRNDKLLYEIYAEQNRTPITMKEIPDTVKKATLAIEDKDFYKHGALDPRGILRASINILFGKNLQGGSTITQQLVKTTLLNPERTVKRKIREAVLSTATEVIYSKDQILEMYLNHIPYGGTAYGIEQAAQKYFGKSAKDLDLAESALLAGLPAAPSQFSPFGAHPELASQRQKEVLRRMVEDGYITKQEATQAEEEKLNYAKQQSNIRAPHFVMYVKQILEEKYSQRLVEQGGLRVKTTLDVDIQEFAEETVATQVGKLKDYKVSNGSLLVTKPSTGEILAMVGSKNYFDTDIDGNVNLTTSLRQPGSSIKPVNYAIGLANGYTAADMFLDVPTCFAVAGQPAYCPKNYDGKFHGAVQMRFALANSFNIPAVKMLAVNGVEAMIASASAMGITGWKDPSNYGLSLTLGGGEVTMTQMATAFGVFANSGKKIDLIPILKVSDYTGKVLEENDLVNNPPVGKKVISPAVAFITSQILLDNGARETAFGPNSQLVIPGHAVSVKTGTTDDLRDNWTIGYTPSYLVAAWVGNNDNSVMNPYLVSGVTGAAPIWNQVMKHILKDQPDEWPKQPGDVKGRLICTYLTSADPNQADGDCRPRNEWFIDNTAPREIIEKKKILIDKSTGRPPDPGSPPPDSGNLEEQEHIVGSDMLTKDYCLDCPHDGEKPVIIDVSKIGQLTPSPKPQ